MRTLSVFLSGPAFDGAHLTMPRIRPAAWLRVASERRRLRELDDARLADIGLTRAAAEAEASRPFWDIGRHVC